MKKVYVVQVKGRNQNWQVSSLAFYDVRDAILWVETRTDMPKVCDAGWYWIGANNEYNIVDVDVI